MLNRKFTTEPLPLIQWAKLTAAASYPEAQFVDALYEATQYIAWLNALPTLPCDISRSGDIDERS